MSIIKQYHKDTGITYVYESESYWDKEKKQPRSRRKLIGKLDDETGEIIPTGKKGHGRKKCSEPDTADDGALRREIHRLAEENQKLRERSFALEAENNVLRDTLKKIGELTQKA